MAIDVDTLITETTEDEFLQQGLDALQAAGVSTTSWRVDDPTRVSFVFLAQVLGAREQMQTDFIRSGFLSKAEGDWLKVLALELYGVEVPEPTHATSTLSLTNAGGGYYNMAIGDVLFSSSTSGKTYRNTTAFSFAGPGSLTVEVEADEAGSDSSAGVNDIDTIVSPPMLGVSITASTVAVGQDSQSDAWIRQQCEATLGALSPNGPPDAYEYVARNSTLTGTDEVTRAYSDPDAVDGATTVYVASASGAASGAAVTAVQDAIMLWAKPIGFTPTVVSATEVPIDLEIEYIGTNMPDEAEVEAVLAAAIGALDFLSDDGTVPLAFFESVAFQYCIAQGALLQHFAVASPANDPSLAKGELLTLNSFTLSAIT